MEAAFAQKELPPVGFLQDLEQDIRQTLAGAGRFRELPAGSMIAQQGKPNDSLTIILTGKAQVFAHDNLGNMVQLATLGPGDCVGEMNIFDPANASADVYFRESAKVWSITESEFESLVARLPAAGYAVLKFIGRQLCHRLRNASHNILRNVETTKAFYRDNDY